MNSSDVEKLAREAGFQCLDLKMGEGHDPVKLIQPVSSTNISGELSKFAALVLEKAAENMSEWPAAQELRQMAADIGRVG